jgi:Cytidine and deoxycytidylate deaminase zinc-binding region
MADGGCYRCANRDKSYKSGEAYDLCICVHTEQNAILAAARFGISTAGRTMYTTMRPCFGCAKEMLVDAGEGVRCKREVAMSGRGDIQFSRRNFRDEWGMQSHTHVIARTLAPKSEPHPLSQRTRKKDGTSGSSASPLRDRRGACLYAGYCWSRIIAKVFVVRGPHQSAARFPERNVPTYEQENSCVCYVRHWRGDRAVAQARL